MSTENTSKVGTNVELLRAALERAKGVVEQLERDLADAEHDAATVAVLAMIETPEEPIPAEPVPDFVSRFSCGPTNSGQDVFSLAEGDVQVTIHPYYSFWRGVVVWSVMVFDWRRFGEVEASPESCQHIEGWENAVRAARRMFARWSAPVAGVAIAA